MNILKWIFTRRKKKLLDGRYNIFSERVEALYKDNEEVYTQIRDYLEYINKETDELLEKLHNNFQPQEISSDGNEVLIEQNDTNMDFISNPPPYNRPFTDETIRDTGANTISFTIDHLKTVTKKYNELTGIQIDMVVVTGHIYAILAEGYGSVEAFEKSENAFRDGDYELSKVSNLFERWNNTTNLNEREEILNEYEIILNDVRDNMFSTTTKEESLERVDGEHDDIDVHIDNSD